MTSQQIPPIFPLKSSRPKRVEAPDPLSEKAIRTALFSFVGMGKTGFCTRLPDSDHVLWTPFPPVSNQPLKEHNHD